MSSKNLVVGDLVWAKMKNFPYWPAKIVPPIETKCPKKSDHYVYFFGSEDHAWISDEHIVSHSEDMLKSCKKKRASVLFQNAIDEIVKAALEEDTKPKVKLEKPDSDISDDLLKISMAAEPKKKARKMKTKNSILKAPKRRLSSSEEFDSLQFRVPKIAKLEDTSSAASVGSPAADGSRVAVIRPFDDAALIASTSKYTDHSSVPLQDMDTVLANLKTEHVKPTDKIIGFLGLGMMGRGIVRNLLSSGHQVIIWNRSFQVCDEFVKSGAIAFQEPSKVVQAADIIFCCVSDAEAVKTIIFAPFGVIDGLKDHKKGKGYVEMSSIDVEASLDIAEAIQMNGGRYLEAPIVGNSNLAEAGCLTVLASGDRALFNDCETCFHAISRHAYFVSSDVGQSSRFNLIHSMLMGTICGALGEAFALAKCLHVNPKELMKAIEIRGLSSPLVAEKSQAIIDQNFTPSTLLKHQQKTIDLALRMSDGVAQTMPVSAAANELYKHAKLLGYSYHDMAAVYQGAKY